MAEARTATANQPRLVSFSVPSRFTFEICPMSRYAAIVRATALSTVRGRNRSSRATGTAVSGPSSWWRTWVRHPSALRIADQPHGARASGCMTAATAASSTGPYPERSASTALAGPAARPRVASSWARSSRRTSTLAPGTAASSELKPADEPFSSRFPGRRSRCAMPVSCRARSDANSAVALSVLTVPSSG